ncbi:MAG: histidine phosphatase family protein [Pseudomonadota bacterium]|nr:histidine phosphatase family protein [Pseudomonadota bacterium]
MSQKRVVLIRHGKAPFSNRLYGRTDYPLENLVISQDGSLFDECSRISNWIVSPAKRCIETFKRLRNGSGFEYLIDDRLWEQDFGSWEGMSYAEIPDLGTLSLEELASFKPPNGESFHDVCNRVQLVFESLTKMDGEDIGIVAHSGIIRGFLACVIGSNATGLQFLVDELSVTQISIMGKNKYSILGVNQKFTF